MKYLYENKDEFKVERKLGQTWYYCGILKSAIEKYGLAEAPDYDELNRIVKRIDIYMESPRFVGNLGAPIYCTTDYHSDVRRIREEILKMDGNLMPKEQIKGFYRYQIKNIDKATELYKSSLWSS
jgi:hypothetical protein